MIESIHDVVEFFLCNGIQSSGFRQILPNES